MKEIADVTKKNATAMNRLALSFYKKTEEIDEKCKKLNDFDEFLDQVTRFTLLDEAFFFPVNRVEHQKLNQTTPYGPVWLSFWSSTRPSADIVTN